jgi:hypothetical protein
MASIEKTVFISYRRKDRYEALAVYQYLTSKQYDVFLDYTSIPSGDFEQSIVSNIKARAHFLLILTPTALDRCSEPGDWLRREIETAIDEKRNIIPLFFDGFSFSAPGVAEKLTGRLGAIKRYNGLDIPAGYFTEAMERLCEKYLDVPLEAVLHPVPTEVRKVVEDEQTAANQALEQKQENIDVLVKSASARELAEEKIVAPALPGPWGRFRRKALDHPSLFIGAGLLIILVLGAIYGSVLQNSRLPQTTAPTQMQTPVQTFTPTLTARPTDTQTLTPTPQAPPTFVSHIVFPLEDLEQIEFETEPGMLPEETITDFLKLTRVAFGELGSSDLAYSVELRLKNTGAEPILLDLDERFFSLVDEQGQAAELGYFCCASRGDVLSPGQERAITLIFPALPGWVGKELSSNAVFFRVRGLLPVLRATWRIPTLAVAS